MSERERLAELLRMLRQNGGGDDESDSSEESSTRSRGSSVSSTDSNCQVDRSFSSLKESLKVLLAEPERPFRPGDIVKWKEGFANRKRPKLDEFAVVVEVLPVPLYGSEKSSGSPYFHEPHDLVLGMLDSDGDFVRYIFDKRRFCLVSNKTTSTSSEVSTLRKLAADFNKPCTLRVGDAVKLKPGFCSSRVPNYNTIAVVSEVLPQPYRDTTAEEGTTSFYQLISGRIAFLDSDGDITFLYVDLRRFRKIN